MAHDLDKILADVLTHFRFDRPKEIRLSWGAHSDLMTDGYKCSAVVEWANVSGCMFIAVNDRLRRAPRHVIAYLIFHECLHIALPPRKGVLDKSRQHWHHRAFRVAERIWPTYTKSNDWLLKFWASH